MKKLIIPILIIGLIVLSGCVNIEKDFRNMAEIGCRNEGGTPIITTEIGNSNEVYIGCSYKIPNNMRNYIF